MAGNIVTSDGQNTNATLTSAGDLYNAVWADYGGTSTIVGWSGVPAVDIIQYKLIGKLCFVCFYISGTSDTTTVTFTLPYTSANTTVQYGGAMLTATDNGTGITSGARCWLAANSATVSCYTDMTTGAWTNTGTKAVQGQFWYETA